MLLKKVSFLDERKRSFVIKFFDAKFASETGLSFWSLFNKRRVRNVAIQSRQTANYSSSLARTEHLPFH